MPLIQGTWRGETLRGAAEDDFIYGHGGNDTLFGNGGNDALVGGAGNDVMDGGTGNDRYFVDSSGDRIVEAAGQGYDSVHASVDYYLADGVSVEQLTTNFTAGFAPINLGGNDLANSIYGNAGPNQIIGNGGADFIQGLGGNDGLAGNAGNDILVGGAGADTFYFSDLETGDRITDFTSGVDHIHLDYDMVESFYFIGAAAFTGVAGQARFANGLFQLDQNGDYIADFAVAISGPLVEADIYLGNPWDY